ncbi:MAG: HlyD family efflux transporter periplasmic adaptor subunit [Bacteroidales bacterium]|nr:HlyD family efflux transporter periplasmic adaptor subunit [Bacteroidales bacterium]
MDRELSKSYLRKRNIRRWISGLAILLVFVGLFLIVPSFMEPTVDLEKYRLAEVSRGDIITSVSTNGKVEPVYQEVITSPVHTKVRAILHHPGDTVDTTTSLIALDLAALRRRFQTVKHEVALKENQVERKREELRERRLRLQADLRSDSLQTERLKARYEKEKELLDIGGTSRETVEQTRIDYRLSRLEQQKLQQEYASFKRMITLDLSSLNLEMAMKRQEMTEMRELLDQARIKPSLCGVITRIGVTPGESVAAGQEVARVSNLYVFRIRGKIPDKMVDRVYSGQHAQVLINDTTLQGRVSSLTPGVEHGDIEYSVKLNSSSYPGLKAKKHVEIRLIQQQLNDTLRIPNANYYQGAGRAELFVMNGGELLRRQVRLGSCSYDYVVVKSGLKAGDQVVISSALYREYPDHQRLKWKK